MLKPAILATFALTTLGIAQPTVAVDDREVATHRLGARPVVRTPGRLFQSVQVEVVVKPDGRIASAKALSGPPQFFPEALAAIKSGSYKPFTRRGRPITARFSEHVLLLPPERLPQVHRTFPEVQDWMSVRITLRRTTCLGTCPDYDVEIDGDGTVKYHGIRSVTVVGDHRGLISRDSLERLVELFRQADYYSLDPKYFYDATDGPAFTTTLSIDGRTASVVDYLGVQAGMPLSVRDLEDAIDSYSGSRKWVEGNQGTVPALRGEGFDFRSEAGGKILAMAAYWGDRDVVRDLIRAGAPLNSQVAMPPIAYETHAPLFYAVRNQDIEVLRLLIKAGASKRDAASKAEALDAAVRMQRQDAVEMLIRYGATRR